MRKLLLRWIINAVAIYAAVSLVPGIGAAEGWVVYMVLALVLGLVNALIAPIVKLFAFPLVLLTLGLFTLLINALMLWLASAIGTFLGFPLSIDNALAATLGALVISIVSFVLSALTGVNAKDRKRDRR